MKNLDWGKLSFGYSKTDYNVRCYYKDGKWSAPEVSDSEMLNIHMASTCLHYGQEAFEGMKAFRGKDGKIRLFRCEENAKRMLSSAEYVMMAGSFDRTVRRSCRQSHRVEQRIRSALRIGGQLIYPSLVDRCRTADGSCSG